VPALATDRSRRARDVNRPPEWVGLQAKPIFGTHKLTLAQQRVQTACFTRAGRYSLAGTSATSAADQYTYEGRTLLSLLRGVLGGVRYARMVAPGSPPGADD
jgi:hypothetical protein